MAAPRNTRINRPSKDEGFGLLANGSSGPWEIAIDEYTSGEERWCAQIEGPSVTFYFEIPSLDIVGKMARFLKPSTGSAQRNGSLVIGKDQCTPVTLVRDDEYDDRFFLVVGPTENPIVHFVIAGTDVVKIADALRQVKDDLDAED
jgi:hypothetical protein